MFRKLLAVLFVLAVACSASDAFAFGRRTRVVVNGGIGGVGSQVFVQQRGLFGGVRNQVLINGGVPVGGSVSFINGVPVQTFGSFGVNSFGFRAGCGF